MIKINLLPEEFRKKKMNVRRTLTAPLLILAGGLFLLLTVFFYTDYHKARFACQNIQKAWAQLRSSLAQFKTMEGQTKIEMKNEKKFLEKNSHNAESVGRILFWVKEFLPAGGRLTELKTEQDSERFRLTLQGIVRSSRTQDNIKQIEEYTRKLRTKLPSQTSLTLTISKDAKEKTEETAFAVRFEWGVIPKS